MRRDGFISNRLFDAAACEAFIISDKVTGLEDTFQGSVVGYTDRRDLEQKVDYYLAHPQERQELALRGAHIVRSKHTFAHRATAFIETAESLLPGARHIAPRSATWDEIDALWFGQRSDVYAADCELECNICGWKRASLEESYPRLEHQGNFSCPSCGSLDHNRATAYLLARLWDLGGKRLLDINPAPAMGSYLGKLGAEYVGITAEPRPIEPDLAASGADSFDVILCRYLLEGVPDDRTTWRGIISRLRPGGLALVHLPVERDLQTTIELTEPDPRYPGRARRYGADVAERFRPMTTGRVTLADLERAAPCDYAQRFGFRGTLLRTLVFSSADALLPLSDP
jgi:SAM-dependent methyltransferase